MLPEKNNEPAEADNGRWIVEILFDLIGAVFAAFFAALIVLSLFCRQVTVEGDSMNDTLHNEERLLVSCWCYEPKCGDIVIVTHGEKLAEPIVKRIIATAGQTLEIDSQTGDVIVDGVLLKEDYIKGITRTVIDAGEIPRVIPEGYVFVMGDNRENSLDSRSRRVGLVPVENIVGKAFMRFFPFDKLSGI